MSSGLNVKPTDGMEVRASNILNHSASSPLKTFSPKRVPEVEGARQSSNFSPPNYWSSVKERVAKIEKKESIEIDPGRHFNFESSPTK
mmetsp:Transcript_18107/g.15798  ORF Transcript_18107/g.15798 Transcript_18107/m.15798 type:complete len:88 (-) Transcript_18107:124-387(-)